ncbi:uncharacterized protein LOC129744138 [Uranotaenia lowii]|uniref:uncharacterized protein LOC129744138 n=1 Tax=Uranotaenia lowii TaxID=190385 RepID=UPI00247A7BA6|nr:uncharacterized protein LOC129744138 [Uranotaenia lowii]
MIASKIFLVVVLAVGLISADPINFEFSALKGPGYLVERIKRSSGGCITNTKQIYVAFDACIGSSSIDYDIPSSSNIECRVLYAVIKCLRDKVNRCGAPGIMQQVNAIMAPIKAENNC